MAATPVTVADLSDFLASGEWRRRFGASALAAGAKMAKARQVQGVRAEGLDTGDLEVTGEIVEKDGEAWEPVVVAWRDGAVLTLDADCGCPVASHCGHAAALLEYLAKDPESRLRTALGETPHAEKMTRVKTLQVETPAAPPEPPLAIARKESLSFLFRLERRPGNGDRVAWLPERYGQAWAIYGTHRVPLMPSGMLPPIVTPEGKIPRDRAREMEALQVLYALDFFSFVEDPPSSLKKLDRPNFEGTLWAVNRQEWPHDDFFWQRFRHEGVPAMERRGWEVRFAPDFGLQPLVFRSHAWRAEIVEEGRGWFTLSAGFEIDGLSVIDLNNFGVFVGRLDSATPGLRLPRLRRCSNPTTRAATSTTA